MRSVMFNLMPEKTGVELDGKFEEKWARIHAVRDDVLAALELKRAEKVIGKPLINFSGKGHFPSPEKISAQIKFNNLRAAPAKMRVLRNAAHTVGFQQV